MPLEKSRETYTRTSDDYVEARVAAAARVYGGGIVQMNAYGVNSGYATAATADRVATPLGHAIHAAPPIGRPLEEFEAGDEGVRVDRRPARFKVDGAATAADYGRRLYVVDDETLSLDHAFYSRPHYGRMLQVDDPGYVVAKFTVEDPLGGGLLAYANILPKGEPADPVGVGDKRLTTAGLVHEILLGAPPNGNSSEYTIWYEVPIAFAGGGITSLVLDVGLGSGDNSFLAALDLMVVSSYARGVPLLVPGANIEEVTATVTAVGGNTDLATVGRCILELRQ